MIQGLKQRMMDLHHTHSFLKVCAVVALVAASIIVYSTQIQAVTPKPEKAQGVKASALVQRLAPHKALYEVSMIESKSGTQLIDVSGKMLYEWQPSCEGWVSNHRFNLTYEYADSPPHEVISDFSNFERFDGSLLNFTSQRKKQGTVYEEIRGHAEKTIEPDEGSAIYKLPKGLVYDLPSSTFFPVAHTLEILKAAEQGKRFFSATIFDGSDEEGPIEVNAFIGKEKMADPKMPSGEKESIDKKLIEEAVHKVRLAFFPLNKSNAEPEYEMSLLFQKNGIITDMIIEYDDFSVSQKLVALEALPVQCSE